MTNSDLDPRTTALVEEVLGDLLTRFEAAEEGLEERDDLPEISPQTEATFLAEIEADLDAIFGPKRT